MALKGLITILFVWMVHVNLLSCFQEACRGRLHIALGRVRVIASGHPRVVAHAHRAGPEVRVVRLHLHLDLEVVCALVLPVLGVVHFATDEASGEKLEAEADHGEDIRPREVVEVRVQKPASRPAHSAEDYQGQEDTHTCTINRFRLGSDRTDRSVRFKSALWLREMIGCPVGQRINLLFKIINLLGSVLGFLGPKTNVEP